MKVSNYVKKINDYKKCMKMLECAHYIFINEIANFEFKRISKYTKSRNIYIKITNDFKTVNKLLDQNDLFNSSTILRTLYENIMYIISTSYNNKMIITIDTYPGKFRKVLEDNYDDLFTGYFEKEDFNDIYKYLCKIVHPSSMKELVSYLDNTIKYKAYMLNNLKYIMVTIEYMFLNYLNKKIGNEENSFYLNLINCCTYVNLVNISCFLDGIKNGMSVVKRYMIFDTNNKYIEENERIGKQLVDELNSNKETIEINIKELTKELDHQINSSIYNEQVNEMFKESR